MQKTSGPLSQGWDAQALKQRSFLQNSGNASRNVWLVPDAVYKPRLQRTLAKLLQQVRHASL